jgi:NTP pyrophosphatase (non-canonical NTP hydrolase)
VTAVAPWRDFLSPPPTATIAMSTNLMNDLQNLTRAIVAFRDRRDWKQFHSLRNLAAGLSIEAAELQEILLWKSDAEVEALLRSTRGRRRLAEEIADVLVFSLLLCHEAGLDPAQVVRGKLRQNAKKYPVRLAKGRALKYTELHWGGRSSSRERRSRRRNQALRGSPSCA